MEATLIEPISRLLGLCNSSQSVMSPTTLYNEGWMLRLVLDWFERHRGQSHPFAFKEGARWYSEARLPSRFLPTKRSDVRGESHTHADGVIGHFKVQPGVRDEAVLSREARQFIVIEAKMNSGLSAGTTNASGYDQAARNVACMVHMLHIAGADPTSFDSLGFYMVAPEVKIKAGVFGSLVTRQSVCSKVTARVASYSNAHDEWFEKCFLPMLECMNIGVLSWESILDGLPHSAETDQIRAFYDRCLHFNLSKRG